MAPQVPASPWVGDFREGRAHRCRLHPVPFFDTENASLFFLVCQDIHSGGLQDLADAVDTVAGRPGAVLDCECIERQAAERC